MYSIVLTGPESTGKSTLSKGIAEYYNGIFIPEYAREYMENLDREYTYEDVEIIAKKQVEQYNNAAKKYKDKNTVVVFDTFLIITKIWFVFVYKKYPKWLDDELKNCKIDLYVLCKADLDWIYDPVRENGSNEMRNYLYNLYKEEILKLNTPYIEISGKGEKRLNMILDYVNNVITTC
ncbi:MAG: AAA family ATPase [Bacteroidales bacterium]|jgi:NadR type nicotinamide-nucleotide adenylyltransferase